MLSIYLNKCSSNCSQEAQCQPVQSSPFNWHHSIAQNIQSSHHTMPSKSAAVTHQRYSASTMHDLYHQERSGSRFPFEPYSTLIWKCNAFLLLLPSLNSNMGVLSSEGLQKDCYSRQWISTTSSKIVKSGKLTYLSEHCTIQRFK